ncbi:transglutaminase domain-containing protein [Flavobacterium hauense]
MKNTFNIFLLLLLSLSFTVNAQDFAKVDATVKTYPKTFSSPDKLAEHINKDFKRDDEKARAIFTWIATNIKYDYAAYGVNERPVAYKFKTQEEKEAKQKAMKQELAQKTLKSKKGVCQGYATLYMVVAEKAGLECELIPGTSKSHPAHIGKAPGASDHAWNAVKIGSEWKLLDTTWGAGTVTGEKPEFVFKFNDKYFFSEPDTFFLNHFPDDKRWLLTDKTEKDFANLPLYYGDYLMKGYDFTAPSAGSFKVVPSGIIEFKVKNLKPGDMVHYAYSRDRVIKEVTPELKGDTAVFNVSMNNGSVGTLTIYINQKSVAAYKINKV